MILLATSGFPSHRDRPVSLQADLVGSAGCFLLCLKAEEALGSQLHQDTMVQLGTTSLFCTLAILQKDQHYIFIEYYWILIAVFYRKALESQ